MPSDPRSTGALILGYLEWMRITNYSEVTLYNRERSLTYLRVWLEERGITRPTEVTKPILDRYQRWLYHYRKQNGQPLSFVSQYGRLVAVRSFFKWLARENHILYNPASELTLPRLEKRLPKHVLTVAEVELVINQPNIEDPLGLRDRAILETLYSTGIRRMELIGLKLYDLDVDRGTIIVRQGKGKKDRMIPIGDRAVAWIESYLRKVRPMLVVEPDRATLFLSHFGDAFEKSRLTQLVRGYVKRSGVGKRGSCHLFRHTMATLMLDNGADIRYIQEMLGHVKLTTTQLYTQVSIRKLKAIHTATHPARLERTRAAAGLDGEPPVVDDREDLFSSLAAEAVDEEEGGAEDAPTKV